MRVIIMADGKQTRWLESVKGTELEGVPKQLVKVDGEPILHRTIDLLRWEGVDDIWITTHNPLLTHPHAETYQPENNLYEIDKLLACKPIWNIGGVTIFLYGDSYYSRACINKIIGTQTNDFLFFGRFHVSHFTGHGGELHCKKIKDHDYMEECANWVKQWEIDGNGRGGGWEFYRRMCGITDERVNIHCPYDHFIGIDDFTDDFDGYEQYKTWEKGYNTWRGII